MDRYNLYKSLLIQFIGIVLTALVLDQGIMFKSFLAGCLIFWLYYLYKKIVNKTIGRFDSFLLKYGMIVLCACVYIVLQIWMT